MDLKKKTFDAITESRKWRETASRRLDAMTTEQRLAYLQEVGKRYRAQVRGQRDVSSLSQYVP